jgi:hypothetical protein
MGVRYFIPPMRHMPIVAVSPEGTTAARAFGVRMMTMMQDPAEAATSPAAEEAKAAPEPAVAETAQEKPADAPARSTGGQHG